MKETIYRGLWGVEIKEVWEDGMMNVACDRGYGMSVRVKSLPWPSAIPAVYASKKVREE